MTERTPSPQLKQLGQAPTGADVKSFLDYLRQHFPSKADKSLPIKANVDTTTHTLSATAADAMTYFTNASGCTITVNVGRFKKGQVATLCGTQGQLTLAAGGSVTIHTPATLRSRVAYSTVSLLCNNDAGSDFTLMGDLEV